MPHDRNGKLLEVGDSVKIVATVKSILMQEDYCNLTLDLYPMPPYMNPYQISVNAKQVEKLERSTGVPGTTDT